ncbi:hypothetical protein Tco_0892880 [Tanacetum coccineum]|uniref:Retrotransposon gag domain-containing protein n=1 Tax=Tanacetum coccineum TaxID=301880 RepID=A0ABQ5C8H8_9ASTR
MNPQETQQVIARDEKWVPSIERVKISSTNVNWRPLCIRRKRHFKLSLIYYASSKKSKKTIRRQPGTGGSSEGTGRISGVPDESIVISATSSEGTGTKPGVLDKEKVTSEENVILEWGSEQESEYSEEDQGDDEEVDWLDSDEDDEKKDDDKSEELVNDNEDEEMSNVEFEDSRKGDAEISDVAKADSEKIKEIKDDAKKAELPLTSSSLSVSSGFGDQFLKLSSDTSLVSIVKDTTDAEINSLLDIKIQSEVPHIQSPFVHRVPVSVIFEPSVLALVQETPSVAPVTTLHLPSVSTIPHVPHQTTSLIPTPPSTIDAPTITTVVLESGVLSDVMQKERTPSIELEPELEKSASKILKINKEQVEKQNMPQYITKSTNKATLKEYDQKSALYQTLHENKSFNRNLTNHALYHVLMKALIEDENAMDKGVADTIKNHKRQHDDDDDDEDPPIVPNQGKAPTKGSKYGKSATANESIEEPIAKVIIDDAVNITGEDVVHDDNTPQDTSKPKKDKTPNQDWFKQSPRPPTSDPEWNKRQVVLDQPEQPWIVLRVEKKLNTIEQPIPPAPVAGASNLELEDWNKIYDVHNEELKSMFEKQVGVERFDLFETIHACKQEEGQSVSSFILKMKSNVENYNMHNMGKIISELHALLIGYEKGLPKKAATLHVLAIQGGRIQKPNEKPAPDKGCDLPPLQRGGSLEKEFSCLLCWVDEEKEASWFCQYFRGEKKLKQRVVYLDYGISVSKNDVLYFNAIPRDGIYEIDMLNLVPNVNYIYNVSNKRAKHNLDSTYPHKT